MFFAFLVLITALTISAVAGYYSIVGLMAIFSGASLTIAIMGSVLEVGKLVTASWLYNNWRRAPLLIRIYLTFAVIVLMFITSMGIFGYLSKAHLAQVGPSGDMQAQIEKLDFDIAQHKTSADRAREILARLDKALEKYYEMDYVSRALREREKQASERAQLQAEVNLANAAIDELTIKKFELGKELRGIEAEIGPLRYLAALVYGDRASEFIDESVRAIIIILIFVFDPLAVLLVVAGNMSIRYAREDRAAAKAAREGVAAGEGAEPSGDAGDNEVAAERTAPAATPAAPAAEPSPGVAAAPPQEKAAPIDAALEDIFRDAFDDPPDRRRR